MDWHNHRQRGCNCSRPRHDTAPARVRPHRGQSHRTHGADTSRTIAMSRDQRGQAGGLEALAVGVLVFVLGTLAVAGVWGIVDAKWAVSDAAREATRTYVESGADGATADRAAQLQAMAVLAGHHRAEGAV